MYILGVAHDVAYLDFIDATLRSSLPLPRSLMLELAPSVPVKSDSFFVAMQKRYTAQVLYGDTGRVDALQKVKSYCGRALPDCEQDDLAQIVLRWKRLFPRCGLVASSDGTDSMAGASAARIELVAREWLLQQINCYYNFFPPTRDEALLENALAESPDWVAVGDFHARFLKREMPSCRYVRLAEPVDELRSFLGECRQKPALFRARMNADGFFKSISLRAKRHG
jgi:hypothetical protein